MLNNVKVTVDRPLGSYHPMHNYLYYPINYGYVDGVIAPDGEAQDAYILGVNKPIEEFTGKLIAVIHRRDDIEDKWVVAPKNVVFTLDEINEAVSFQEKYFDTEIEMLSDIEWIFFDVGSTLVDENDCIKRRCETIISQNNINRNEFYGKVFEFAKTENFAVKAAAQYYGFEIPRWYGELEKLYPYTQKTLEKLSEKYKLGIIANQVEGTKERLDNWGIGKYFKVIAASAEEGAEKPDLKIFKIALDRAGCKAENALMVGDRLDNDILPAKLLGMKTIWVKQGLSKYQIMTDKSPQPTLIINSLDEIV